MKYKSSTMLVTAFFFCGILLTIAQGASNESFSLKEKDVQVGHLSFTWMFNESSTLEYVNATLTCNNTNNTLFSMKIIPTNSSYCMNQTCLVSVSRNDLEDTECTFVLTPMFPTGKGNKEKLVVTIPKKEIPAAPMSFTGRARRNEIIMTWTKANGDRIKSQTLSYGKDDGNTSFFKKMSFDVNISSYTVSGLMANTSYVFNLTANNVAGSSMAATLKMRTDMNVCPGYDWDYSNGDCYYVDDNDGQGVTQNAGQMKCSELTSTLASVLNDSVNIDIVDEFMSLNSSFNMAYIGLNQTSNDTHIWLDGSAYNFQRLLPNTTYNASMECNVINTMNKQWESVMCTSKHGYICKRSPVTTEGLTITLNSTSFNKVVVTLPRTSLRGDRPMAVYVNGGKLADNGTMKYYDGQEITIDGLKELENVTVVTRENFNGLGPLSDELVVQTRAFVPPGKAVNVSDKIVLYAESTERQVFWAYHQLGDSMQSDLQISVTYCTIMVGCHTEMFGSSPGKLTGLKANTAYNYTLTVMDVKYNKTSMETDVMNFTTSQKDTCQNGYWFCVGGTTCVMNSSLCDNQQDCPLLGNERYSADELSDAGCKTPTIVNVTEKIAGLDFIRITWERKAITERVVSYTIKVDSVQYNVTGNMTSFRIDNGIRNSTSFEITIFAINPTGDSPSYTFNITTANMTDPTGPITDLLHEGSVGNENMARKVMWKLPSQLNNNDPQMLNYKLKWCYNNATINICSMVAVKNVFSYEITGLMSETNYTLEITVLNEFNQSSDSSMASFMTPVCNSLQFECVTSKMCINGTQKCDGMLQCGDMSDELASAGCSTPPPVNFTFSKIAVTFIRIMYYGHSTKVQRFNFRVINNNSNTEVYSLNITSTSESGEFNVTKLNVSAAYWVTATAFNYVGEGERAMKKVTTLANADQPSAPIGLVSNQVAMQESSAVSLEWSPSQNSGGVLQSELKYQIKYCQVTGQQQSCKTQDVMNTNSVLKGLMPNTTYNVSVFAIAPTNVYGVPASLEYTTAVKDDCSNNSNYFQCPVQCIMNVMKCNGIENCKDGSDEVLAAGCSTPGRIESISNTSLSHSLGFNWTAPLPESYVTAYHLVLNCSNGVKRTVKLLRNVTMFTFENLTTPSTATISCDLSIFGQNLAGNGTINMKTYEIASLTITSEPTSINSTSTLGLESSSISLSWQPPLNLGNGRADQLTYQVKWCDNKGLCKNMTTMKTSFEVTELKKGTEYNITITPINALNEAGKPLLFSFATLQEDALPTKPLAVSTKDHENEAHDKIEVSWKAPDSFPGLTENEIVYNVSYCKNDNENCKFVITKEGITEVTLGNLTDDKLYEIVIRARGRNGMYGEPSDPVSHKTDRDGLPVYAIALIVIAVFVFVIIILAIVIKAHFKSKYKDGGFTLSNQGGERSKMNPGYTNELEDNV